MAILSCTSGVGLGPALLGAIAMVAAPVLVTVVLGCILFASLFRI